MRTILLKVDSRKYTEWEEKTLGELAFIQKGFTPSTENPSYWDGDIPWLSISGFDKKYIENGTKYISQEALGRKTLFPKGTLVMSFKLTLGKVGILAAPMMTNEAICAFKWKDDSTIPEFMFYALNSVDLKQYANQAAAGLTLNDNALKSIRIPLPSLPEQEKIAEFFGVLDERIELQANKVQLLKEQKQGFLQQVFNRDLVFTDDNGDSYPEWETEQKLSEVSIVKRGASPRPIAEKRWFSDTGDRGWVRISDVSSSGKYLSETTQYLSPAGIERSVTVEPGSLILSIAGSVGKPAITKVPVCIHDGFIVFRDLCMDTEYLFYFLELSKGKWDSLSQSGSQSNLNSEIVGNLMISLPSLPEQQKIAEFFSVLDERIELNENKLALLKEQKKGYLQGIFG